MSGDTLYGISKKYNISVDEIKNINNLSSNLLSVGQIIKIPNDLVNNQDSYLIYTVKKGDTLYSIANKYNTSVDKIKAINNLSNNNLTIGSNLKIPV